MARKTSKAKPPKKKPDTLTPKQEAFARAYLETASASAAYRKAYDASGMQDPSIYVEASKLMANPKLALRIAELQEATAKRHNVTVDRIIRELALIGFANMMDYMRVTPDGAAYVDFSELTREQAAAISEVTSETYVEGRGEEAVSVKRTKFKLSDKRAALVDLGKHLGMFVEQKNVNATITHVQAPQATGEDHLEELTRRYALKTVQLMAPAAAAAKPNGKAH